MTGNLLNGLKKNKLKIIPKGLISINDVLWQKIWFQRYGFLIMAEEYLTLDLLL